MLTAYKKSRHLTVIIDKRNIDTKEIRFFYVGSTIEASFDGGYCLVFSVFEVYDAHDDDDAHNDDAHGVSLFVSLGCFVVSLEENYFFDMDKDAANLMQWLTTLGLHLNDVNDEAVKK